MIHSSINHQNPPKKRQRTAGALLDRDGLAVARQLVRPVRHHPTRARHVGRQLVVQLHLQHGVGRLAAQVQDLLEREAAARVRLGGLSSKGRGEERERRGSELR